MIPFVGRLQELARLSSLWEQARAGAPQHLLVTGEAGIGKTRLVEELAVRVRAAGGRVLRGRCWDVGAAPSYWPWTQAFEDYIAGRGTAATQALLADVDPDLVRLLPRLRHLLPAPGQWDEGGSEATRLRLFEAVSLLLRRLSAEEPLLVLLDDLESADEATLQLLRFLIVSGREGSYMVVAVYRSGGTTSAPATGLLATLSHEPGVVLLRLGGLGPPEIAALIDAVHGDDAQAPCLDAATALQVRTGGNPLFAVELLRLQASAGGTPGARLLPASIRALIGRRLAALPEPCRDGLGVAALVGLQFELGTVAAVVGASPDVLVDRLAPAIETRICGPCPGRPLHYAFSHPLVRETLVEGLAPAQAAELHRRVAEVLRSRFVTEDHLDAIASHYLEALPVGTAPLAVEFCRRAAARASTMAARDEAVRLYQRALDVAATLGQCLLWCEIALELGEAQARAGQVADARATFLRVTEHAETNGDPVFFARAALGLGGRFVWARAACGSHEVRIIERALERLPVGELALRARLLARRSGLDRDRFQSAANAARCRTALELARQAGDHATLTSALNAAALHELMVGTPERLLAAADELLAVERAADDLELELQAHDYRAMALLDAGDTLGAEVELAICDGLAERLAQPAQRWFTAVMRAQLALLRGELDRAEALADAARAIGEQAQPAESRFCHLVQLVAVRREQRRLAEVEPLVEASLRPLANFPALRYLRAQVRMETGNFEGPRLFLDQLVENGFASLHDSWQFRYMLALTSELAFRTGHTAAAAALAPLLAAEPHRHLTSPASASAGSVWRYRSLVAAVLGEREQALAGLRQAAAENRAAGAVLWALRCDLDRARLLAVDPTQRAAARALAGAVAAAAAARWPALELEARGVLPERDEGERSRPREATRAVPRAADGPLLRREGEFWTVVWSGKALRLRDGRGLHYLARLLGSPGRELAAAALVADVADAPPGFGDDRAPQPILDPIARAALARRHDALASELEEAEAWNDRARSGRLRAERDQIAEALAVAVGMGGRGRAFPDPGERARQSVTKALRAAIRRLAAHDRELGQHLHATVRTGFLCCYRPDPLRPPWRIEG